MQSLCSDLFVWLYKCWWVRPVVCSGPNCWVFLFHGCMYLGIQYVWVGGRRWEWSSFWDYLCYCDPVEALCFSCQDLMEWVTATSILSICWIHWDGQLPSFSKTFHCIFGAFDQEQQSFESKTFFIVRKRAWFTSSLCLGSLTCRPRIH